MRPSIYKGTGKVGYNLLMKHTNMYQCNNLHLKERALGLTNHPI